MNLHRADQQRESRARNYFLIAGTLVIAHSLLVAPCTAQFSRENFKRVWLEHFGPGVLPDVQSQSGSTQHLSLPQQPHPAVARIIVPEGEAISFGSGTLIDIREGFGIVITNWHVVRDAQGPIEVIFPGGFTSKARVLKMDADWDLAALVVWQPPVKPVTLATRAPHPGDLLTICGYGPGIYRAVTGRCTQYYAPRQDFPQQMVELSAEARQGDSGGPILNSRGELAGVLFGAGNGTTLGSFSGRVGEFLATLAPDIGSRSEATLVSAQISPPIDSPEETAIGGWQSASLPFPESISPDTATVVLDAPSFDREAEKKSESKAVPNDLLETPLAGAQLLPTKVPPPQHHLDTFDKIKSALAAFGLFSLVVMFLKAAG